MNKDNNKSSPIEIHETKPHDFNPRVQVAACYIEMGEKLLWLERADNALESRTWCVPGGKLEVNETPSHGAHRELLEETGIHIEPLTQLQSLGALYIRKPDVDFVYHMFKVKLDQIPAIRLSEEHLDYTWATLEDLKHLNLISGANETLKLYQERSSKKLRIGASVNAYLILQKNYQVLLHLRRNTGYCDGMYGLVSGHVEDGESASSAIIRETFEEANIQLAASDLKVVHVLHRQTDRLNVDIFFECHSWLGDISNKEPDKCSALDFYPFNDLPSNTIGYLAEVFTSVKKGLFYSEQGWGGLT